MAREFVFMDGFKAGELGEKSDRLAGWTLYRGILVYQGTWRGTNVRRNIDGSVSARPGLRKTPTLTGLPAGKVLGFGSTQFPGKTGWCVVGTTVYLFDLDAGGAVIACTGALAATPTVQVVGVQSGPTFLYITCQGDQTYVVDLNAETTTAMANSPGGAVIGIYDDLLCVGNMGGDNTNRIAFSDPYAPGGTPQFPWPSALNFIDVGDAWPITAFAWQRTRALIGKQSAWYELSGVPNTDAVLRLVLVTDGPLKQSHSALTKQGLMWYVPIFTDAPTEFNGSTEAQIRNLRFANRHYVEQEIPPAFGVTTMTQPADVAMVAGHAVTGGADRLCEFHNGAWAFQQFGVTTSGFVTRNSNGIYICDGGADAAVAKVYLYACELDRPVKVSDSAVARFGDDSDTPNPTSIQLPEWEARDGSTVHVRAVILSFKKWNTGSTDTNHVDVKVTSMRQAMKSGDALGGQTQTGQWDEPASKTEFDGQYQETEIRFGGQGVGNGFRLTLENLRGVSIQKIQVLFDQGDTRS